MVGKKIKNIVFDMGKVLLDYDPLGVARHFMADPQETELLRKNVFESEEWLLLDRRYFRGRGCGEDERAHAG